MILDLYMHKNLLVKAYSGILNLFEIIHLLIPIPRTDPGGGAVAMEAIAKVAFFEKSNREIDVGICKI
jgi:hypothetical protein